MRLVLVDNPLYQADRGPRATSPWPPLGLLSLVAVAQKHGHEALVIDPKLEFGRGRWPIGPSAYETAAQNILAHKPDAVGFSALGCSLTFTVGIAMAIREAAPHVQVLAGGPHATMLASELMDAYSCFDTVFRGEAEESLPIYLENGGPAAIAGTTTRVGTQVVHHGPPGLVADLDQLPMPAYDAYPVAEAGLVRLPVEAGRGCPFRCDFCSSATFFGRRYRLKSADRLWAELDWLSNRFDIDDFDLVHDMFTASRKKVIAFCRERGDRTFRWRCSARIDCVDPELVRSMAEAGCTSIFFGVEFGSKRLQRASQKGLDLEKLQVALDLCIEHRIRATVSFITGHPQEDAEDQRQTFEVMNQVLTRYGDNDAVDLQLHELTPEPGTKLWNECRDTLAYDGRVWDFNVPPQRPDDEDAIRQRPELFMTYHYYPGILPRHDVIGATTAWHALRPLGSRLIGAVARGVGGLDQLIGDLRASAPDGEPDGAALLAWVVATWGKRHPITSLVRLRQAVASLRFPTDAADLVTQAGGWQLDSSVRVLEHLHDVSALESALRSSIAVDERSVEGELHDQLIRIDPALEVYHVKLDDSSARVLWHIRHGRVPDDLVTVERLVRRGWVIQAGACSGPNGASSAIR